MHPHPHRSPTGLFLDFCVIFFPKWPLIFLVCTIRQVIWRMSRCRIGEVKKKWKRISRNFVELKGGPRALYGWKVAGLIWIRFAFFPGARYYVLGGHDDFAIGSTQDRYYLGFDVHQKCAHLRSNQPLFLVSSMRHWSHLESINLTTMRWLEIDVP